MPLISERTQIAENDLAAPNCFRCFFTDYKTLLNCFTRNASKQLRVTAGYQVK